MKMYIEGESLSRRVFKVCRFPCRSLFLRSCNLHCALFLVTDKLSADRVKAVMEHIWKLQEFVSVTTKLQMDSSEFAYLKAAVLFSPGEKQNPPKIYLT